MIKIYYNRKSIRLKNYDYAQNGMYFITICTKNREEILSKIEINDCRGRVPPLPSKNVPPLQNVPPIQKNVPPIQKNVPPLPQKCHKYEAQTCQKNFKIIQTHTEIGKIIEDTINNMNQLNFINIGPYVIMPNHVHFIVELNYKFCPQDKGRGGTLPLHAIIGRFKSYTTKQYNLSNETFGIKLWQRNYYEHIIRDKNEYYKICEYIKNNPIRYGQNMLK